jgi:hypothetical protein
MFKQNPGKKIYRAKTPGRKETRRVISTEGRNPSQIPRDRSGRATARHLACFAALLLRLGYALRESCFFPFGNSKATQISNIFG